jgi:hypothetical protein
MDGYRAMEQMDLVSAGLLNPERERGEEEAK